MVDDSDIQAFREHEQEKAALYKYRVLLLTTFIIAGSSIVYELLISAAETYLMGNSTLYYAIVIGVYMASLGLGAFLSRYIRDNLFSSFAIIEIALAVVGGVSTLAIFEAYLHLDSQLFIMFAFVIGIGALSGLEIPLLTRIIEEDGKDSKLRLSLSAVMSLDYIGSLVGSVAFPLALLPHLGYYATAFVAGSINLAAALIIVVKYGRQIGPFKARVLRIVSVAIGCLLVCGIIFAQAIADSIEGGLYRDQIIYDEQSTYQHIVMTRHRDDLRLYLDGNLQFSSEDEKRYHEPLVHIPMAVSASHAHVLVLGGGDGLAAREILKYDDVEDVTLVDLDPAMTNLCSERPDIVSLNHGSLSDGKMTVINEDAYLYLQETDRTFDVIIVDLPDPNNDSLAKLYSDVFYRLCSNAMNPGGALVVQSTSPYFAKNTFWCINKTLAAEGFHVYPYHSLIPSFGDWGYNLAVKGELDVDSISLDKGIETAYLDDSIIVPLFSFSKDEFVDMDRIETNTMSKPIIMTYYNEAIANWD